jgi:DNA-binding SARP family transcriptional activator
LRFEILGSLRVVNEGRVVTISARKMEIVLATLLIRTGQIVSVDQLIEEVWGQNPPRRATATLYVYISQLRKLLYSASGEAPGLETRAPGYLLRADDDALDLHRFQRLVNDGRAHSRAGRPDEARRLFEPALALWRGPVLADLRDGPIINGFATWLDEVRLEVIEMLNEANLELGRHRELVSALYGLVREHPFHEAFYRQLMIALCRSERRVDALRVFQNARTLLNQELGIEPGPRLQSVQREILNASECPGFDLKAAV